MKTTVGISVIIYHSTTTSSLEATIDSITTNSSVDVHEIIVVSSHDQGTLIRTFEKYKQKTEIRCIQVSPSARRMTSLLLGYKESTGEYICFLDGGDIVSFDYFRMLAKKTDTGDADIIAADVAIYQNVDNVREDVSKIYNISKYFNLDILYNSNFNLTGLAIIELFMKTEGLCKSIYMLNNKIYSRTLINSCYCVFKRFIDSFGELDIFVDIAISNLLWINARRFVNVHDIFHYRCETSDTYIVKSDE